MDSNSYEIGRAAAAAALDECMANGGDLAEAMHGLASDLFAEMAEWDSDDPLYEEHCEQYYGMLSRLD